MQRSQSRKLFVEIFMCSAHSWSYVSEDLAANGFSFRIYKPWLARVKSFIPSKWVNAPENKHGGKFGYVAMFTLAYTI